MGKQTRNQVEKKCHK